MLKIYKETILVDKRNKNHRLGSSERVVNFMSKGHSLSNLFAISIMIIGALLMTIFFSVLFALFLIPACILGTLVWWKLRQLKSCPRNQSFDAEYTVITETSDKYNSGKQ